MSIRIANPDAIPVWEKRLKEAGYRLDDLDLSEGACVLLAAADRGIPSMPRWLAGELADLVRAPTKVRKTPERLAGWILRHWWRADVRRGVERALIGMELALYRDGKVDPEKVVQYRDRGVDWVQVLWTVWQAGPEAVEVAREVWGAEDWDRRREALLAEARPVLWVLLTRPMVQKVLEAEYGRQRVMELEEQLNLLDWEAGQAKEKHRKATERIRQLVDEVEALRAQVEDREQRIRDLEAQLAEERKAWVELVQEMRGARRAASFAGCSRQEKPLAGKRVVIVGGDPVAAGAVVLVEALGGEVEHCPGYDEVTRVGEAVARADLVVGVTSYMSHKHMDQIKLGLRAGRAQVVWVNHTGLTAVRRALEGFLGVMEQGGEGQGNTVAAVRRQ